MKGASRRQSAAVGLFVLFGGILLAGGILKVVDPRELFGSKIVVHTVFDDVRGLQPGANVWFSGVKVGTVRDVRLGASEVAVDIAIDWRSTPFIPEDSQAKVGTDALLGNKIIVLYGGKSEAPLSDGAEIKPGETVSTDDMFAMLQENNENLLAVTGELRRITSDLAEGKGTAGRILSDDALYDDLRAGASSFGETSASAKELTDELERFASKLNREGTLPNDLATDTETYASLVQSAKNLAVVSKRAETLMAALDAASKDPNSTVGTLLADPKAAEDLKSTLSQLDEGSSLLAEDLEALQHTILLRHWFKKREKEEAKAKEEAAKAAAGKAPPKK